MRGAGVGASNPSGMDERSRRIERRLEPIMIAAALLVIPLIVIEESSYGDPWDSIGVALNWGTWLVFVAEAGIMLAVVPSRWVWIRRHPIDVAVVILTPPFLAALAPVRLLRLLRLLRLVRLASAARVLFSAEGVRYAALLAALTVVAGGAGYASLEGGSTLDGMYWAITTMTTVGYGDLSPQTGAGKALASAVMLVGIGFVAILTGAIAERFLKPDIGREAVQAEATGEVLLTKLGEVEARLTALEASLRRVGE
jgi:voltage-gated potassium channel